jgi:hypothetical protein
MQSYISTGIALPESTAVSGTKKASLRPRVSLVRFEGKRYLTYSVPEQRGVDSGLYLPRQGICGRHLPLQLQLLYKVLSNDWQLSKAPTDPTYACGFRNSMRV